MGIRKTKIFLLLTNLVIFSLGSNLSAQKYTAEFLNIGVGARAMALGGAYVAIASDASAVYWNPAGLAQLNAREISLMHSSQFSGLLQANFINFVTPLNSGQSAGISYFRAGVEDIPVSTRLDENNRPIIDKYIHDLEHAIFLSFANQASEKLFIGGNLKAIYQDVASHSALGFGIDIGALYKFSPKFSAGICARDVTGTFVFWDTGIREIKYPDLAIGVSLNSKIPVLPGSFRLAISQTFRFEGKNPDNIYSLGGIVGADSNAGMEYEPVKFIALRIGIVNKRLTSGVGLSFSKFSVHYAFVSFDLGNVHRISGNIYF